ncbi:MAG: glycine--tRNA ligase subunit beta [Acidobacteria bacterium]|nr:glycine--tRNA ligase subunit beta [Acidobacteriota bacterium]
MPEFLLEIGTEEIPARMIASAQEELERRLRELLARERLTAARPRGFSTPRRLAVLVSGIPLAQADVSERLTGPAVSVAFRDGQPTAAAHAFAKKAGVEVTKLDRVATPKGEYLSAQITRKGRPACDVIAKSLAKEIASIYWPKSMYWQKPSERFVRPVRWLVAMLDDEVVPFEVGGVRSGNRSRGHRILSPGEVLIPRAGAPYVDALSQACVLDREEREQRIRNALAERATTIPGARWCEDLALLETVVNLTEWPSVIVGSFDGEFLRLPEEILITVMRDHQKYFALRGSEGKLLPHFLAVLNTDGDPQGLIRHGNERVLRARFNDARFFWESDQKHSLRERLPWLKNVTFQKDLGNYYEKTMRVQRLCSWASEIIREAGVEVRPGVVHKAACLAKTDLTTELVKEFTELEGIVGGLYASVQTLDRGMPAATQQLIAEVIYDQYKPKSADDSVPRSMEGAVLSICDKADTIAGMFALGLAPTGSKDPFALRRQANAIVKTIAEHKLPLSLLRLLELARETYRGSAAEQRFNADLSYAEAVQAFFRERFEFYLGEQLGVAYDVVKAVVAAGCDDVSDAVSRAKAVGEVRGSPDFDSISVAFKRIKNILRQARETGKQVAAGVDPAAFREPEEKQLGQQIPLIAALVNSLRQSREYAGALAEISRIRPAVDLFFDRVMVMVEDERLRANRLALLETLLKEFSTIADFSEIVIEGKS